MERKVLLDFDHSLADAGQRRRRACHCADLACTDIRVHIFTRKENDLLVILIPDGDVRIPAKESRPTFERGRVTLRRVILHTVSKKIQCHGPVHRAGIHIDIPQFLCDSPGDGALPRACRSVDRNRKFLPVVRIHKLKSFHYPRRRFLPQDVPSTRQSAG